MWIVGLLSVSFFLHVLAVDRRLHERLCCHAAPFIDNNGIHGWFIAWGHEYFFSVNNKDCLLHTDSQGFSFHTEYHGQSRIFFFLFLSRIIELSNFCLHTEYHGQSRIFFFSFLVPNFRIFEFQSHGISRTVTDFLSRIIEFYLFVPRLVLGPTDRREVIFEFLSSVTFRDIPCDKKKIR